MKKNFNIKGLVIRVLLLLPLIYIGYGWYTGINYSRKPTLFGPYPDIPMVMKTSLLGSSIEDISGAKAIVIVSPLRQIYKDSQDDQGIILNNVDILRCR